MYMAVVVWIPSRDSSKHRTMKKSELLRALQTEIELHNLWTFINETDKVVEVGRSHCKKRFGTTAQFGAALD